MESGHTDIERTIQRGSEAYLHCLAPSREFIDCAIAGDLNGELKGKKVYGGTRIGLRTESNEDGILTVPRLKLIANADGVGGGPSGEVASLLALASIYQDSCSDPKMELGTLRARAHHYLANKFAVIGFERQEEEVEHEEVAVEGVAVEGAEQEKPPAPKRILYPATTLAMAREVVDADGRKFSEGFTMADHRALVIDKTDGRILFLSKHQTYVENVVDEGTLTMQQALEDPAYDGITNCVSINPPLQAARYFREEILPGHTVYTLLYTDGIDELIDAEDVFGVLYDHGLSAGLHLMDQAERRQVKSVREGKIIKKIDGQKREIMRRVRDNISIVIQESSA